MKNKLCQFLMFVLVCVSLSTAQAQTAATEGRVVYDMKISGKDIDPMTALMLSGANVDVAFKGHLTRAAMRMTMMNTTAVIDNKAQKGLMLMDMMGKKMAMNMTQDDFKDNTSKSGDFKITKTASTKKIAGYLCTLAVVQDSTGEKFDVWYTDKIKYDGSATGFSYEGIDGLPLEIDVNQDGMKMRLTAKSVTLGPQDAKLFSMAIPSGYKLTTQEELAKEFGQ